MAETTTPQGRALWTFLITTLAAPFLAGLVVFFGGVGAGLLGRVPAGVLALDRLGQVRWSADQALQAFVWSAWPAALAGAVLAGLVIWRGRFGWLESAIAGGVSASLFGFLAGSTAIQHLTPIAFVGAGLGVMMWEILTRAGIVRS